jgi:hypothetical protein
MALPRLRMVGSSNDGVQVMRSIAVVLAGIGVSLSGCRGEPPAAIPRGNVKSGAGETLVDCEGYFNRIVRVASSRRCIVPRRVYFYSDTCPTRRPFSVIDGHLVATGLTPRSLLWRCGLRNGDWWLRVNGVDLKDPERLLSSYADLQRAAELAIDVSRDGRLQTFTVEFEKEGPPRK